MRKEGERAGKFKSKFKNIKFIIINTKKQQSTIIVDNFKFLGAHNKNHFY